MEFRRRRHQSGYFLSVILWLNKLANSSRLLTVRIGRRGCDEWRWIAFLASVFVIVSSDLKTDGKKKRWIRTLTVIYMSLYGKRKKKKSEEKAKTKNEQRKSFIAYGWVWLIAHCVASIYLRWEKQKNHSILGDLLSSSWLIYRVVRKWLKAQVSGTNKYSEGV